MFQLTLEEVDYLVSQNAIPSKKVLGGSLPYAFTEQSVSSISGVLTNKTAVEINIKIMRAFVEMRKVISSNELLYKRLDILENKQFKTDEKIEIILSAIEDKNIKPKQGIFYNGQIFDAHSFVSDLIRDAK